MVGTIIPPVSGGTFPAAPPGIKKTVTLQGAITFYHDNIIKILLEIPTRTLQEVQAR
jgi:hypothetical protein